MKRVQWAGSVVVVVAAAQLVLVVQQRESRVGEKFPKAPAGGERAGLKLAPAALTDCGGGTPVDSPRLVDGLTWNNNHRHVV